MCHNYKIYKFISDFTDEQNIFDKNLFPRSTFNIISYSGIDFALSRSTSNSKKQNIIF